MAEKVVSVCDSVLNRTKGYGYNFVFVPDFYADLYAALDQWGAKFRIMFIRIILVLNVNVAVNINRQDTYVCLLKICKFYDGRNINIVLVSLG